MYLIDDDELGRLDAALRTIGFDPKGEVKPDTYPELYILLPGYDDARLYLTMHNTRTRPVLCAWTRHPLERKTGGYEYERAAMRAYPVGAAPRDVHIISARTKPAILALIAYHTTRYASMSHYQDVRDAERIRDRAEIMELHPVNTSYRGAESYKATTALLILEYDLSNYSYTKKTLTVNFALQDCDYIRAVKATNYFVSTPESD
jgi:hypothetical protein